MLIGCAASGFLRNPAKGLFCRAVEALAELAGNLRLRGFKAWPRFSKRCRGLLGRK